jgi:hypothetical protein
MTVAAPTLPFAVEATGRNVTTVRMDVSSGWEAWFLLRSDAHHDNLHCNQKLERKHLDMAKERGAGIIDAGDLFCAMQGKWDRRADQTQLREELRTNTYLDDLVKYNAAFYAPYAHNFVVFGFGNHETGILKHHQTHLTERMAERLKTETGAPCIVGGYGGWVRFLFTAADRPRGSKVLHYFHGSGGGGPVTRGVISTNRMAVFNPDADFVLTGHTHDEWCLTNTRSRLNASGVPYLDEQLFVRVPGYKEEYEDGYGGYHVEGGRPPKPNGAAWLHFTYNHHEVLSEVTRAK